VLSAALCYSFLLLSQPVNAQNAVVTEPVVGDLTQGIITNGLCVGGTTHANILDGSTEAWSGSSAVQFGACSDQFAITMAINQSLSHTGISVDKLHYKWKWINGCFNVTTEGGAIYCDQDISNRLDENFKPTGEYADQFDTLNIVVTVTDSNGNVVETKTYDYDTWYHWAQENSHSDSEIVESNTVWQVTEDFIEFFNHQTGAGTIYTPSQLGNVSFVTTGQDNGQWEGFYGPVVKDQEMWFTYTTNPCDLDSLYHPTCEGYAKAYTEYLYNQACAASPLYDSGCVGYAAAFLNQQCTLNSLYDQQCPMYQIAYFNQQCDLDSQYDLACPNYQPEIVEEITAPPMVIVEVIPEPIVVPEIIIVQEIVIPQVEITPETAVVEEITTESIEMEIAELEAEIEDPIEEPIEDETPVDETTESEPTDEPVEEKEEPEKEETTEDDVNDESVDKEQVEDAPKKEEKPQPVVIVKKEPTKEEIQKKKESRKAKIKQLIADKIAEITKEVNSADTIEEQMVQQARLVALIAFVPDFDYGEMEVPDIFFYPPEPVVDHEFARWFVNDPTFGAMEDLQYPNLR